MRWLLLLQSSGVSGIQPTVRGGALIPDADDGAKSDFAREGSKPADQTRPLLCSEPCSSPSQPVKAGVLIGFPGPMASGLTAHSPWYFAATPSCCSRNTPT